MCILTQQFFYRQGIRLQSLKSEPELEVLNGYFANSSYLSGEVATQVDRVVFEALQCPPAPAKVHLTRWYKHIASFSAEQRNAFTGVTCDLSGISVILSSQVSNNFNHSAFV